MTILPRLELKLPEILPYKTYITIHTKTGWSVYKEWDTSNWEKVVAAFPDEMFIQIGLPSDPKIAGCNHDYMNIPLMDSIALITNAKLHLGIDSFSNHITHMSQTPAVILWGSTHYIGSGYPHNTNISLELPCSPCYRENPGISSMSRGICPNPPNQTYENPRHACMTGIKVETVVEAIKQLIYCA